MLSIIDYGMGNLRSVINALEYLGVENKLVQTAEEILDSDKLILPGVGSFREAMENLIRLNIVDSIQKASRNGKPILGICLGMQLLAEYGEEGGLCNGLGLISGRVKFLNTKRSDIKVPHMGFNQVEIIKNDSLFSGIKDRSYFYFVHSYHFNGISEDVAGVTDHGIKFTSVLIRGNVIGTQFHPEKSQSNGLRLLKNFCER